MVERYQTIIVGRVEGVREVRNLDALNPTPRLENTPPRFLETVFDVKVLEVIFASRVSVGQNIGFYQLGATVGGDIVSVPDVNPLVNVGTTYLLFLEDLHPIFGLDEFTSPAFGRFVVDANRLVIPNGWEVSPGVAAVSGVPFSDMSAAFYAEDQESARATLARRTVDEAAAAILAEIALAPLPPLPTREPVESSAPAAGTPAPAEVTPTPPEPTADATESTPTSTP